MLTLGRTGYNWKNRNKKRREGVLWIFLDLVQNNRSSGLVTTERRWEACRATADMEAHMSAQL